jgi:hypothetical protein
MLIKFHTALKFRPLQKLIMAKISTYLSKLSLRYTALPQVQDGIKTRTSPNRRSLIIDKKIVCLIFKITLEEIQIRR